LPNYDQGWVISSDYEDANARSFTNVEKWRSLADACERFYKSGKGLFVFADNDPFFDHANVVLERLFEVTFTGATPTEKTLRVATKTPPEKGSFLGGHLIGSGLQTLFEGRTICYPHAPTEAMQAKGLHVFAQSTDDHPAICYAENKEGGRLVVDTGFTKLYVNWNSAGTARYICNATVWLLALEVRLNNKQPLRGPTEPNPIMSKNRTPAKAPGATKSVPQNLPRLDVVFVVHSPVSTGGKNIKKIKLFLHKSVDQLARSHACGFGLVQFSNGAEVPCPLTQKPGQMKESISSLQQRNSEGANFCSGLDLARRELPQRAGNENSPRRVIVFLASNDNVANTKEWTNMAAQIRKAGVTIVAVRIGKNAPNAISQMATSSKHAFFYQDYNQLADNANVNALVRAVTAEK